MVLISVFGGRYVTINNMSKKTLLLLGIILSVVFFAVWFFTPKQIVQIIRPVCDPAKTDCSKFTPDGTPFVRPPEPVSPATTTQVGQIDEHLFIDNTLKDVNFCGKTYHVKQVKIDGVDVVQRIARLINSSGSSSPELVRNFADDICKTVSFNPSGELELGKVTVYAFDLPIEKMDDKNKAYGISAPIFQIAVRPSVNAVYLVSGYDGSHQYLTNLK